ncbi:hypothetical protein [Clostridium uliginosum]|uniref:Uncharacterized protein n=1 Tax=Clostridium uliginosum TaxID=119641 RepID=A0A1I1KK01_9CLOT|nr:hypothetical protein [Clostridium uliginosum]SFC60602.1 hypothetical protein SAMN05421842_10626 [Clostridium uliginosum]
MEFILNKIDTDIRNKLKEETKDDKVHNSNGVSVAKDLTNNKKKKEKEQSKNNQNKNRYLTIDAIKSENRQLNIEAEKLEATFELKVKGRVLDIKK